MKLSQSIHFPTFPHLLFWKKDTEKLGISLAFCSLILHGTYIALAKSLTPYLSPISLLLVSEALMALFVVLIMGLIPLMKILAKERGKVLFIAVVIGVLNSGIAPILWFKGLAASTAVNASILDGTNIVFALLFARMFLKETPNPMQFVGAAVVFTGVMVTAIVPAATVGFNPGDLYIILATMSFAGGTVLFKKYLTKMDPEAALFVRSASGVVFALVVSSFLKHPFLTEIKQFPMEAVLLLISFAFFSRFLTITFFYAALDRAPAMKVSLIMQAAPISSIFFAVMLLGERLYVYHVFGAMLILFGLLLEEVSTPKVTGFFNRLRRKTVQQPQQPYTTVQSG